MNIFENAAERLKNDYQKFIDYLDENEVMLSKRTEHIGKKDCYALNQRFDIVSEKFQSKGRTQDNYTVIDFFYFFSVRSDILRVLKKKGLGLTFQRTERYQLFSELSAMEQYILMVSVWIGEYHEALSYSYSSFGGNQLFKLMNKVGEKLTNPYNTRVKAPWGERYSPEIRLFGLFQLIRIEWLDELDIEKENKFRIKQLYQSEEGYSLKKILDIENNFYFFIDHLFTVLSEVKKIAGENSDAIEEKLINFWTNPLEKGLRTIEFKVMVGSCIRRIKIGDQFTLEDLHDLIQESIDFDRDHLYYFKMGAGTCKVMYYAPECRDEIWQTDLVTLAELKLYEGMQFEYMFDFGDQWHFKITVESILDEHSQECEIWEIEGEAPEQYSYEDWE